MANGKVTNDKIYDLINSVRLELKEDIHQSNLVSSTSLEQLKNQQAGFLARQEYLLNHKALEDKVDALVSRVNRSDGKTLGLNAGWVYLLGAVALLGSIAALLLNGYRLLGH